MPVVPFAAIPYVTVDEVRALPGMASPATFPAVAIEAAVAWFEAKFEEHAGVAFTTREVTERYSGTGRCELILRRYPVVAITAVKTYTDATTYTAFTAGELADLSFDDGIVSRFTLGAFTYGNRNIEVTYVHGFDPTPPEVKDACLVEVADKLKQDVTDARGGRRQYVAGEGIATILEKGIFETRIANKVVEEKRSLYRVPALG